MGELSMAQNGSNPYIFHHLFQRLFQHFLIFIFVIAQLSNIAQIIDGLADFTFHLRQFRLHYVPNPKQEMVNPTSQCIGAFKHADSFTLRQQRLEHKPIIF